jgi:acetyltransferase-like isoleucine patch superfamily enzyme
MGMMVPVTRFFGNEVIALLEGIISAVPGTTGQLLRQGFFSLRLRHLGRNPAFHPGIDMDEPRNVSIGDDFVSLRNCTIHAACGGSVEIGDDVSLAANVVINAAVDGVIRIGDHSGIANNCVLRTSPHNYADPDTPFKSQGHTSSSILIGEDVWIAANCTLVPGTRIGRGAIVASGSVVGGTVKEFAIVAGNPARVIGRRGG